jgi:hypothetical protein
MTAFDYSSDKLFNSNNKTKFLSSLEFLILFIWIEWCVEYVFKTTCMYMYLCKLCGQCWSSFRTLRSALTVGDTAQLLQELGGGGDEKWRHNKEKITSMCFGPCGDRPPYLLVFSQIFLRQRRVLNSSVVMSHCTF